MRSLTFEQFQRRICSICQADTSSDPGGWTTTNPLYGHCAVVTLLAQDFFGGDIIRVSLQDIPEFAHLRSHYWNRLRDGREYDFTRDQFCGRLPANFLKEIRTRDYLLSHVATCGRYLLLKKRFES